MPKDEEQDDEPMTQVVSSNLSAVGWADDTLTVEFNNGATYEYDGVSREEFYSLRDAASPGGYFNRSIKGRYEGRRA